MKRNYKVIDDQIQKLKDKGLTFKNEEMARKIILRENYYNITEGYENVFIDLKSSSQNHQIYEEFTYFEELYATYQFDRNLKELILDYMNRLEINIKSYVAYAFSNQYGDIDYLKRENFDSNKKYDNEFNKLQTQIHEQLTRNFQNKNSGIKKFYDANHKIPLWILVQVFTFGTITNFYCLMKIEQKQEVAQAFQISPYHLGTYLKMLNIVRNICAHGDILFNIRLHYKIKARDCNYHELLAIPKVNNNYICGLNDLFSIIILLKKLLSKEDFEELFSKMEQLLKQAEQKLDHFSYCNLLVMMGFPQNYNKLKNIV